MIADLSPLPPFTPLELFALAASVRAKAAGNPWVADRVAAALEAVARYRETRSSALAQGEAAPAAFEAATPRANKVAGAHRRLPASFTPKFSKARKGSVERSWPRHAAANPLGGHTLTDWSPLAICKALLAAERGQRMSRLQRDALAAHGWIEFVYERGHPAHRSGRAWLFTRLTAEGHNQLTLRLIALGM
ncbi:MAG: hypothetical protein EON54_20000 [Alcaligenaceae bacterium]|nr:MAG: hypothetical protein EON54_20000 [Alcaligenaceae bacterium]